MSHSFLKKSAGVTLIELLLALVISTILTAGIYRTFLSQHRSYKVEREVADMQQNSRVAVNRMLRELRMAGFGGRNESISGENEIIKILKNVNGYTAIITPEDNVVTDGITHDRITVIAAYDFVGTLKADANKGSDKITLDYTKGVKFNSDKKKYLCINSLFNYEVKPTESDEITLKDGTTLNEDHKAGAPVFMVEAITYGLRMDNSTSPPMPVLFRNQNTGGGRVTVAENIESLSFRYRVRKKSDLSDGGEVDNPDLANYFIVGVRVTLVARTMESDPELKVEGGFRRRAVETYIDVRNLSG